MQIGRFRETRNIRQPSRLGSGYGMEGQRLVFLYPMLCDQSLQRMLQDFRDFFTVCFVSEIKISNALNITSDSYNVGSIGRGQNAMNPAQMVRKAIWAGPEFEQPQQIDTWTSQENRAIYQDRILQFNSFIRNQIQHDPRYSRLRPVVSSITVENLINIPLIVGTQTYQVDTKYLYWILLVATVFKIPLDSTSNLKRIFSIIDVTDKNKLLLMISDDTERKKLVALTGYDPKEDTKPLTISERVKQNYLDSHKKTNVNNPNIRKLITWTNENRSKAEVFFNLCLDKRRWEAITGNVQTREEFKVHQLRIPTGIQKTHYDRAMSSFQFYVENCIVPILHSVDVFTGPSLAGTSLSKKIGKFLDDVLLSLEEDYIAISDIIITNIQNQYIGTNAENPLMSRIIEMCKENADIGSATKSILDHLDNEIHLPSTMFGPQLTQFYTTVTKSADQLYSRERIFDKWLKALTETDISSVSNQLENRVKKVINSFHEIVSNMFWRQYPSGDVEGYPWLQDVKGLQYFKQRYSNYYTYVIEKNPNIDEGKAIDKFYQMVKGVENSIVKLLIFFFKWNFFSYTCSYLNDVEVDIEIQSRDALDFPNYCLVLPFDLFKGLYMTRVVSNFKQLFSKNSSIEQVRQIDDRDVIPNMSDVNRLINMVNNQLKIPNIILVDQKTNTCYYKFMYMTKPVKVNLSQMKSYIKHQKDVLPGF